MREKLEAFKSKFLGDEKKQDEHEVIEAQISQSSQQHLALRTMVLESYQDTEGVLAALREGGTMVILKIRPLREKDMPELKRSVNRLKTHCAATGAKMNAIDDNWIFIVPPTVHIDG
jgi:SepF-like predicted cell division protein (DUF552 family)